MKQWTLAAMLCAVFLIPTPVLSVTPPQAPDGFSWQELTAINGFALVPDEWRFRISEQGGKLAYFVTRDPITAEGFDTGMTINVIRALPLSLGVSPTAFARDFVMQIENTEQVERRWTTPGDTITELGVEWIDREPEIWVRNHNRLMANDGTGTLYHVTFRTPEDTWVEVWPQVQTVLDQILLDGSI